MRWPVDPAGAGLVASLNEDADVKGISFALTAYAVGRPSSEKFIYGGECGKIRCEVR